MVNTRGQAVKEITEAQNRQRKGYNKKQKMSVFKVGDEVLKKNIFRTTRKGAKKQDIWKGPLIIYEATSTEACYLERSGKRLKRASNGIGQILWKLSDQYVLIARRARIVLLFTNRLLIKVVAIHI